MDGPVKLHHPNRETATARTTRTVLCVLLVVSAALMLISLLAAWDELSGMRPVQVAFVLLYLGMTLLVMQWRRGVLPVAAAFGIIVGILALVAGASWFPRAREGFDAPALGSDALGLITFLLVPLQLLLIVAALKAFSQNWQVEAELPAAAARPSTSGT